MYCSYTDDPVKDFENYDRASHERAKDLPVCADCGEPITEGGHYEFDGECFCVFCAEAYHWKRD